MPVRLAVSKLVLVLLEVTESVAAPDCCSDFSNEVVVEVLVLVVVKLPRMLLPVPVLVWLPVVNDVAVAVVFWFVVVVVADDVPVPLAVVV